MSDVDAGLSLRLAFDTDDREFMRGFEAGRLYALACIEAGEEPETVDGMMVHGSNAEIVMRIAESLGAAISSEHVNDEWIALRWPKQVRR